MSRSPASLAPMTDRLVRPDWVRRINLMAGSVGGHARDLVPLDVGDLLDTAVAALGGRPDGDLGDPRWQERFEALVAAVDAAGMHVVGRLMTKEELLRSLRTRLLLTAAIDAAPEITRRPVTAPVIITGPARSGTSILFELLALDPDLRAPTAAEALHPVTLPEARAVAAGAAALAESPSGSPPWPSLVPSGLLPCLSLVSSGSLSCLSLVPSGPCCPGRVSCRRGCCPGRVSCRRGCCPGRVSCRRGCCPA